MKVRLLVRRSLVRGLGLISMKRGFVRAVIARARAMRSVMRGYIGRCVWGPV